MEAAPRLGKTGGWGVQQTPPFEAILQLLILTWPFHFLCSQFSLRMSSTHAFMNALFMDSYNQALGPQKWMCTLVSGASEKSQGRFGS